ncbi:ankyrin repeat-containing domain protein [Nemania sp. FL0031]|nr:ankyrin repeat-containing domain protein [Nemania sp. FL0031]
MSVSPVLGLPLELLYYVSKCLNNAADLSSWSRSCRAFHIALTPLLYRYATSDPAVMCWACDEGRLDTVQRLLDAGANPNIAWSQCEPRWWTLKDLHKAHGPPSQRRSEGGEEGEEEDKEEVREGELEGDVSLSREMLASRDCEGVRFRRHVSEWLTRHTAIDHRMLEYFGEKSYHVDDDNGRQTAWYSVHNGYLVADEHDVESRPWTFCSHSNTYKCAKTLPQRCYWTPLHIAASWGNDKLVGLLLDHGADINALSRFFCSCAATLADRRVAPLWTPLHTAMCHGHESTARLFLSRGASTNVTTRYRGQDERRFTALHSACVLDLIDTAQALVNEGHQTDVMVHDHSDLTPFAYAFFRGNWAMIDFLLEHGADLNAKIGPLSALGHACLLGYYAEALRLLDLGATPQCELDIYGQSPIYFHLIAVAGAPTLPSSRSSIQRGFRLELVDRLIKHGVDVNQRGINGTTALMGAATFHRVGVVKALLHSGANLRIENHRSILERAVSLDMWQSHTTLKGAMLKTVRVVLEAMAETPAPKTADIDVMELDIDRFSTADHVDISNAFVSICSTHGKHQDMLEVADLLLRYTRAAGMANTKSDLVYDTIMGTNFDIANMLLESGFDPPREEQFRDMIQIFLTEDIDLGLRYLINRFPEFSSSIRSGQLLCEAVDNGSEDCVGFLINEGVSVDSRNKDGSSLLFSACVAGDVRTAEVLLKNGADPDEYTEDGVFLTTIAAREEDTAMVKCLLDYGASIHSSPPNKPTPHGKLGFLDIAITLGLLGVVDVIVYHENYGSPTDEEISRHWHTLINAPLSNSNIFLMAESLFESKKFDANQVFTTGTDKLVTTPLHTCAAIGVFTDQSELIERLIYYGADIHTPLAVKPGSQNHGLKPGSRAKVQFEGTSPLEWAIEFSSLRVVRALIYDGFAMFPWWTVQDAKALCRRQKPEMFSLLFNYGLDPNVIDEDGNTMIHMICDYVETFWPNDEPEWKMDSIAERAAYSIIACLTWNVPSHQKNKSGVSGVSRILEIVRYSGDCEFHQTLAERWRERIEYVDGPKPKFVAKFPAIDDADRDEALLDPQELYDELHDDSDSDDNSDDYSDGSSDDDVDEGGLNPGMGTSDT